MRPGSIVGGHGPEPRDGIADEPTAVPAGAPTTARLSRA